MYKTYEINNMLFYDIETTSYLETQDMYPDLCVKGTISFHI